MSRMRIPNESGIENFRMLLQERRKIKITKAVNEENRIIIQAAKKSEIKIFFHAHAIDMDLPRQCPRCHNTKIEIEHGTFETWIWCDDLDCLLGMRIETNDPMATNEEETRRIVKIWNTRASDKDGKDES